MQGEIISVGTELLLGQITNTNARFLGEKLATLGINVYYTSNVGDNAGRLKELLQTAWQRSNLIILTGGLGPTLDDLTKEVVAAFLGLELVLNDEALAAIKRNFASRGRTMTENNIKQAVFPIGAEILANPNGTAPGMWLAHDNRIIILLPGPPFEMEPMFLNEVVPRLERHLTGNREIITSRVLKLYGVGESHLESLIKPLIEQQSNPTIAPLAKETEVHLRLTAKAASLEVANKLLAEIEKDIRAIVGRYVFAVDEETMEEVVGILLQEKEKTIGVAESCTGGLIGHRLTQIPGSSKYFSYGAICYSNSSKEKLLAVEPYLLQSYGAVSEEVAAAMAAGVKQLGNTTLGLAVTGIAGPGGGSPDKPVGTVYIALATPESNFIEKHTFRGPRRVIKMRTSQAALDLVRRYLQGYI